MSAESDARTLARLRARQGRHAFGTTLTAEEFDLLLRIADERDQLRRDLCEREEKGDGPRSNAPDGYVVRTCPECGHSPHGVGMICWHEHCPCRGNGGAR
ncbi:hypothetical protein [Microbacterium testaceum]|uniref:hypothetical protein n=1 Tax=Microbacterium testaceum TaxID=2033 RepID=UPI001D17A229|nr:hypothetical protein [Microbacterium testaceum]MCC4250757.1 hypothetical protein [Microbacterium testaceum]